ncbi:putative F-box protein At3g16210 [Prosopis cineraria]|uniref:putative F-box protein At3g16210 n=1 Tax=Prosopis cineraria TaxID=364024 RepID=UPI0024101D63|nr:putative F-box protein At3g16210 [Prosopis cineraria]
MLPYENSSLKQKELPIIYGSWKILIKTPSFIKSHLHQSAHKNPFLLFRGSFFSHVPDDEPLYLVDCKTGMVEVQITPLIDPLRFGWDIVGSCNGLLCVETSYHYDATQPLLLWNPAIREVMQVPGTTNVSLRHCRFGFGFSPTVNDYKIVKVHYDLNSIFVNRIEVYSLRTRSWKELTKGVLQNIYLCDAVDSNGTIFWLGGGTDVIIQW